VIKVPEGDASNVDLSVPSANLWICVTGTCDGPGEGNLLVVERALNVQTADTDGDTVPDGLGAYEFSVEYDRTAIQSVNPCDIVFSPGGAGQARGNVQQVDGSIGCPQNPPPINGTCSFSAILENVIHFGCVTIGLTPPGPTGSFDLAYLNLIPVDLANTLKPADGNGIVTVIKDNGCELADVFGHPVSGSAGGGLLPVCGDLAVTVRMLEGDVSLDCRIDLIDEQAIAFRYGATFGSTLYSSFYDLEPPQGDLDIDIKDLQKVFGRDGSTCQLPLPPQPPGPPPQPFG
jgi:hypothetical protein